jgi:tetratricopeptide (TPR) repeat protein
VLAERGDLEGARHGYEESLRIHPRYAPALYGLGLFEQEHGDVTRALELYRRATEALPGMTAAHLNLGSLLAQQEGREVEAAQAFEQVLELEPDQPDAHYDLALLLLRHGQAAEALPHLEAATSGRPDFAAAWQELGEVHEVLGDHVAAISAYERALADPSRWEAARGLAWILATAAEPELRDPPRALELARLAAKASARADPRALETLAAALARSGDTSRAAQVQEEALRLVPPGQQGDAHARLELYRRGEVSSTRGGRH